MLPDQFWNLTWVEFEGIIKGYEARQESEWQRTRTIYALLYNINSKRQKSAKELIPLPSDKIIDIKIDIEKARERFEYLKEKWK